MKQMFAGHLQNLLPHLQFLRANRAATIRHGINRGQRFDGRFRRRGVLAAADRSVLDARQLVEQLIESGAHDEIRDASRQRAEPRPRVVGVEQLEAVGVVVGRWRFDVGGGSSEDDYGIVGRLAAAAAIDGMDWFEECGVAGGAGGELLRRCGDDAGAAVAPV